MTSFFSNKLGFLIFVLLLPGSLWAQSYQLGTPTFSGSGCPPGSAAVSVSPDGSSISFLFDHFAIGFKPGVVQARKADCAIKIPLTVTPGYIVEATTLDYRGFADLPNRASAIQLTTTGVLSSGRMAGFLTRRSGFVGPVADVFTVTQDVPQGMPGNRKCPDRHEINLLITASLAGRWMNNIEFTLDSADIGNGGLTMGVALRACK